ncbi:hypothetical protein D3C76_946240 [compost metagenome]
MPEASHLPLPVMYEYNWQIESIGSVQYSPSLSPTLHSTIPTTTARRTLLHGLGILGLLAMV